MLTASGGQHASGQALQNPAVSSQQFDYLANYKASTKPSSSQAVSRRSANPIEPKTSSEQSRAQVYEKLKKKMAHGTRPAH